MITVWVCIIVIMSIIGAVIIYYENIRYDKYITEMANEKTFEEIEDEINKDNEMLERYNFKGEIKRGIEGHLYMWKEVKKRKQEFESHNYEDIIS